MEGERMYRKLTTALAVLATTAGVSALASSAQAQISGTIGGDVVDNDALQVSGDPDISLVDGNVAFQWGSGETSSRLTGTLHLLDADKARWRVRVDSFDRNGTKIGTAYDVPDGTPVKKEVKDIPVDMAGTVAPYIARVFVAVEMQGASDKWITKASEDTNLNLHDDPVTILGDGIDVGSGPFGYTGPMLPATFSWKIDDDGKLTGTYSGSLYHDDFARCARVTLRPLSFGFPGDEVNGPEHCAYDNGFYRDADTLSTAPSSRASGVEVAMQSKVGGWGDVNTQRVSVAE
jgi:hypothetical protein